MKAKKAAAEKCLRPGCEREAKTRELCQSCYQGAHRLVKTGETTWEKLEKAGKARPKKGGELRQWLLE